MKAHTLKRLHLVGVVVWLGLAYPTIVWWKESILWVSIMSLYTIVIDHLGGYGAARAEKSSSS
jgi:hypothetical protein